MSETNAAPPATTPTDAPTTREERLREAAQKVAARWNSEQSTTVAFQEAIEDLRAALATPQAPEPSGERRALMRTVALALIATDSPSAGPASMNDEVVLDRGTVSRLYAALASPDSAVGEPAEPPEEEREWRVFEAGYAAALGFAPTYHVGGTVVREAFRCWRQDVSEEGGSDAG